MSTPMTPGAKSENLEDVIDLAWNNEGILCFILLLPYYIIVFRR